MNTPKNGSTQSSFMEYVLKANMQFITDIRVKTVVFFLNQTISNVMYNDPNSLNVI